MENSARTPIHPMMVIAAASVALVSLVGAASIAGLLPNSHASTMSNDAAAPVAAVTTPAAVVAPMPAQEAPRVVEHKSVSHRTSMPASRVVPSESQAPMSAAVSQPATVPAQAPAPAQAPQNSALGIGIGAVVGGLIGNQVGGGNGRKVATIVGAIGGGYVGNEIAKHNQQQPQQ
ncbi:glycine zipper 2TM domain-containing protein [Pseudoduganella violaceinigra]|uniref:glycine zipper 2TM domain-containing protein n=1 Tax=Pseudoduganella violaceinigra TaxID=246602 RepID=UPI00054E14D5|nr:glycine zipper 2TM domain-containing protein [Pseudoduganella violaceinigra]